MPLHHAADLLIGQLHRLHGDLQGANLLLCTHRVKLSGSTHLPVSADTVQTYITIVSLISAILCPVTGVGSDQELRNLNYTHKSRGREKR